MTDYLRCLKSTARVYEVGSRIFSMLLSIKYVRVLLLLLLLSCVAGSVEILQIYGQWLCTRRESCLKLP